MKKLFLTALMLVLGLQALPAGAAAAAQPFVRWAVYSSDAQNTPALFEVVTAYNAQLQKNNGVLAVYGGEDENGVMRYLEIYKDEAACTALQNNADLQSARAEITKLASKTSILNAEAFLLQTKNSGTADKPRMAKLVIDPAQLDEYKKVLAKEMTASVTNEPGVLALLATTETANPNVFHLLELYADDEAYKAHIAGPYFQEYNKAVQTMVTDKTLIVNKLQDVTLSGKI